MSAEITESEYDLFGRLCALAARKLENDPKDKIYQATFYSVGLSAPVYLIMGFGDQAHALTKIFTEAQQRQRQSRLILPNEIEIH